MLWRGPRFAAIFVAALGCAGPSREYKMDLNAKLAARDWTAAQSQLEKSKGVHYRDKDAVLYWLDSAAVLHDSGKFQESDRLFDLAEQRLEELYTRSVTKTAATFLLNDNTDDYRGDPHERSLLHILRALNYAYVGRVDEASVEARKVTAFLAELASAGKKWVYRDDAFAQYLSALFFEDAGRVDDARISYAAAHDAYGWYASAYGTTEPAFAGGMAAPEAGEVVFFHYVGVAPRRESHTIQVAWNDALVAVNLESGDEDRQRVKNAVVAGLSGNAITVAFPYQAQDAFQIVDSEVELAGQKTRPQLVEDISAISKVALEDRIAAIRGRAIARAAVKYVLSKVAEDATEKKAGKGWGVLAGVLARATAAATEIADTRCWSTIPAQIRMSRLKAPPGRHLLEIKYLSQNGAIVQAETLDVEVKPGKRTYVHVRTAL